MGSAWGRHGSSRRSQFAESKGQNGEGTVWEGEAPAEPRPRPHASKSLGWRIEAGKIWIVGRGLVPRRPVPCWERGHLARNRPRAGDEGGRDGRAPSEHHYRPRGGGGAQNPALQNVAWQEPRPPAESANCDLHGEQCRYPWCCRIACPYCLSKAKVRSVSGSFVGSATQPGLLGSYCRR